MNYDEALKYLEKSYTVGYKHSLDVFKKVIENLHNPQHKLKVIHVAGTNGKGSTCVMLRNILTSAGYRTGMFSSPHLDKVNERISIDGVNISNEDFARNINDVKIATEKMYKENTNENSKPPNDEKGESLAFFEIITAAAFNYFSESDVDYVIMEVGLGGRLDSTNIIENPILSVICSIGIDHTDYLGTTIEEIASEKAGIIKNNCPSVLYLQSKQVYNIIKNVCEEKNSEIYYEKQFDIDLIVDDLDKKVFNISCEKYSYDNLEMKLLGNYQINNVSNVLLAVSALKKQGLEIDESAIKKGLKNSYWPGRMEILRKNPTLIIDGAHNIDAIYALKESIEKLFPDKKITAVVAVLKDKDFLQMINIVATFVDTIIITKPLYSKRSMEPEYLMGLIKEKNINIIMEKDYKKAVDLAMKITEKDELICCTGSLYLVGNIRTYVLEELA